MIRGITAVVGGSASAYEEEIPHIRRSQLAAFRNLREAALEYASDPRLDFIFLHLPIPHPLGIFDRHTKKLSTASDANYLDNLVLADQTIAEIRQAVRRAGLEKITALVVSSDHSMRNHWRKFPFWSGEMERLFSARNRKAIPLFVHVPGKKLPSYNGPLHALVLFDLLKDLLRGKPPRPSDWRAWMEQ